MLTIRPSPITLMAGRLPGFFDVRIGGAESIGMPAPPLFSPPVSYKFRFEDEALFPASGGEVVGADEEKFPSSPDNMPTLRTLEPKTGKGGVTLYPMTVDASCALRIGSVSQPALVAMRRNTSGPLTLRIFTSGTGRSAAPGP